MRRFLLVRGLLEEGRAAAAAAHLENTRRAVAAALISSIGKKCRSGGHFHTFVYNAQINKE
jgi:hypothetical protein